MIQQRKHQPRVKAARQQVDTIAKRWMKWERVKNELTVHCFIRKLEYFINTGILPRSKVIRALRVSLRNLERTCGGNN